MAQQCNIRKYQDYDHYCHALYKYARDMAIKFKEHTYFLRTNDKNKIKVNTKYGTV